MSRAECQPIEIKGGVSKPLLNAPYGCVAGCCSGISFFTAADYPEPGIHDDWEGFFVMEGEGGRKWGMKNTGLNRMRVSVCLLVCSMPSSAARGSSL
ncbi:MAG: hypothetical protein ACETWT_09430 [Thermodesulfobacteriota bacterium]